MEIYEIFKEIKAKFQGIFLENFSMEYTTTFWPQIFNFQKVSNQNLGEASIYFYLFELDAPLNP